MAKSTNELADTARELDRLTRRYRKVATLTTVAWVAAFALALARLVTG